MQKESTSLLKPENMLKLPMGPAMERAGPMLPRAESTAVTVASKS